MVLVIGCFFIFKISHRIKDTVVLKAWPEISSVNPRTNVPMVMVKIEALEKVAE